MTESAGTSQPSDARSRKRLGVRGGARGALKAAVRVVGQRGLRHLTHRAVAEEAGVTHGPVVPHFGSRDALIEESLAHAVRLGLSSSLLEPGTGKPEDFVTGLTDMVEDDADVQAYQYELLLEARRRPEPARILPDYASPACNRLVFAALADPRALLHTPGERPAENRD
ncbi:TetR/AcrR family transcriptional regulator [Streptomyces sp. NPDC048282]|uniref:TetR/AcrR family transcriptional regulator n=1 Tax=Streptomyces sp. NPDC048282 TaxID=3365528 RepID=UPI003719FB97